MLRLTATPSDGLEIKHDPRNLENVLIATEQKWPKIRKKHLLTSQQLLDQRALYLERPLHYCSV